MAEIDDLISSVVAGRANEQFGLRPYKTGYDFPQDVGLGGPSTEYIATEYDPSGRVMNFPQIWYDQQGVAHLLPQDDAYSRALAYEASSALRFPRYSSTGQADFYAQNRSALGGAETEPLAALFSIGAF